MRRNKTNALPGAAQTEVFIVAKSAPAVLYRPDHRYPYSVKPPWLHVVQSVGMSAGKWLNAALVLLFGLAAGVRLLAWPHVFADGTIYWYDPDCYLRLQQVWVLLENFPQPYVYNYFQGFPVGTGVIAIPLMEYVIAAMAFPFRGWPGLAHWLPFGLALLPVLAGAGAAWLFFTIFRGWFGIVPAFAGAFVLALSAPHVDATLLGRFDNELGEILLFLLACLTYLRAHDQPERLRPWIVAALAGFVFLLVWRGAILPLAIIGLDLVVRIVQSRSSVDAMRRLAMRGALLYGTMAALAAGVCLFDPWGTGQLFSFNIVSQFHVVLFGLAAVCIRLVGLILEQPADARSDRQLQLAILGGVAVLFAWLLQKNLFSGVQMIGGGNPWIDTILQYQRPGLSTLWQYYGPLFLLAPFSLLFLWSSRICAANLKPFLILLMLVTVALALFKVRFAHYAGISAALGVAIAWHYALSSPLRLGSMSSRIALLTLATGLAMLPNFIFLKSLHEVPRTLTYRGDLGLALEWLRNRTPPAGNPLQPDQKPDYGVLARWDYSGWIETVAQRPSVATLFGTEAYGMEETARFFLASSEAAMREVLDKNGVRYIVMDKVIGDIDMYARLINDTRPLLTRQWDKARNREVVLPTPAAFGLLSSRLYFADGTTATAGPMHFEPVESVRLVYESPSPANVFGFPWEIKNLKIFEYRSSSQLNVRGAPGRDVTLVQTIETNQGRRFEYRISKSLDSTGQARFTLPYAAKTAPGTTGSITPAVLASGSARREISAAEASLPDLTVHLP